VLVEVVVFRGDRLPIAGFLDHLSERVAFEFDLRGVVDGGFEKARGEVAVGFFLARVILDFRDAAVGVVRVLRKLPARALEARDPACGVAGVLAGEAVEADLAEDIAVVVEGEVVGQALFIHDSAQLFLGIVIEIGRMPRLSAACHLPEASVCVFYILLCVAVVEYVVDDVPSVSSGQVLS
jgi:hypothetical protein